MKKYEIEFKWSLIFGLVYLLWMLIEKGLGYHSSKANYEPLFNLLFIPISFILYFLALKNKKKDIYNNHIDWKDSFISGIILCFLVTIISTSVVFITFNFISPSFFENAIALSNQKDMAAVNFNFPVFIKNNIFDKLSFGVVFTAIISYILKSK